MAKLVDWDVELKAIDAWLPERERELRELRRREFAMWDLAFGVLGSPRGLTPAERFRKALQGCE